MAGVIRVGRDVGDLYRPGFEHSSFERGPPSWQKRQGKHVFLESIMLLLGRAVTCSPTVELAVAPE
jgi:hypothetical protein